MRKIYTSLLILFCIISIGSSQTKGSKKVNSEIGVDLMSRYVWRGLDYGTGASIQPWTHTQLGIFNLSTWGGFSTTGDYSEVITMAGITVKGVKFQVNDAFVHRENQKETNYFDYSNDSTRHNISSNIFFGGTNKLPIKFRISTFFYGVDKKPNGDQYYSTYIKLTYPFGNNETQYNLHFAMTPAESVYRSSAGIVDMGIAIKRKIKLSDTYQLPVSASFILNPYYENFYLVFGIHI